MGRKAKEPSSLPLTPGLNGEKGGKGIAGGEGRNADKSVRATRRSPDGVTRLTDPETGEAHGRLVAGCEAVPGMELDNILTHGHSTPLLELAYGPPGLALNAVAVKWRVFPSTLERAFKGSMYEMAREERQRQLLELHSKVYDPDELARLQREHTARRYDQGVEIAEAAMARLRENRKTIRNKDGDSVEVEMTAGDRQREVDIIVTGNEQASVALGQPTKLTGALAGANVMVNQIKVIREVAPVGRNLDSILGALEEGAVDGEIVD